MYWWDSRGGIGLVGDIGFSLENISSYSGILDLFWDTGILCKNYFGIWS